MTSVGLWKSLPSETFRETFATTHACDYRDQTYQTCIYPTPNFRPKHLALSHRAPIFLTAQQNLQQIFPEPSYPTFPSIPAYHPPPISSRARQIFTSRGTVPSYFPIKHIPQRTT